MTSEPQEANGSFENEEAQALMIARANADDESSYGDDGSFSDDDGSFYDDESSSSDEDPRTGVFVRFEDLPKDQQEAIANCIAETVCDDIDDDANDEVWAFNYPNRILKDTELFAGMKIDKGLINEKNGVNTFENMQEYGFAMDSCFRRVRLHEKWLKILRQQAYLVDENQYDPCQDEDPSTKKTSRQLADIVINSKRGYEELKAFLIAHPRFQEMLVV